MPPKLTSKITHDFMIYKNPVSVCGHTPSFWWDFLMNNHFYGWFIDSDSHFSWTPTLKEDFLFSYWFFSMITFWTKTKCKGWSLRSLLIVASFFWSSATPILSLFLFVSLLLIDSYSLYRSVVLVMGSSSMLESESCSTITIFSYGIAKVEPIFVFWKWYHLLCLLWFARTWMNRIWASRQFENRKISWPRMSKLWLRGVFN